MISGPRFPLSIQLLAFNEDYSALIPESDIINKILSRNEYRGVIFTNIKKLGLGFFKKNIDIDDIDQTESFIGFFYFLYLE